MGSAKMQPIQLSGRFLNKTDLHFQSRHLLIRYCPVCRLTCLKANLFALATLKKTRQICAHLASHFVSVLSAYFQHRRCLLNVAVVVGKRKRCRFNAENADDDGSTLWPNEEALLILSLRRDILEIYCLLLRKEFIFLFTSPKTRKTLPYLIQ